MATLIRMSEGPMAPWSAMRDIEAEIDRFFSKTAGTFEVARKSWAPAVDVREAEEAYILDADVPGLKKEDIHLEVVGDTITISGEREEESVNKGESFHSIERSSGSFERSFRIPEGFDAAAAVAECEDGVLHVTLPKRQAAIPRNIDVKSK